VDFAKASEILPLLSVSETGKSRGGKLSVDARTNMIIMTDIASNVRNAKDTVKIFDTPVKQVMIEARIVDATQDFARDLGVRWDNFQIQKRTSTDVPFTTFDGVTTTPGDPTAFASDGRLTSPIFTSNSPAEWAPNLGLVFSKLSASGLTAAVLDAKLALAEAEGKTKIISAPKVIAMNGQAATISRGDSIIIPATENVASTTLDATLSLEVTPTVSYNNYISLDVKVTDDNAPTNTRIRKKSINTKLMVKSGDTVVIGGIYTEDEAMTEDGIPGLRRLPLLGWLFKAQSTTNNKTELLIFLTPTVLPSYQRS
jgi:type IV pilus assembly protein PilQ